MAHIDSALTYNVVQPENVGVFHLKVCKFSEVTPIFVSCWLSVNVCGSIWTEINIQEGRWDYQAALWTIPRNLVTYKSRVLGKILELWN